MATSKEYNYSHFNSEFNDYYSSLDKIDNSKWAESFKESATQANNTFKEVERTMNDYAGRWGDAVDYVIESLNQKYKVLLSNINDCLKDACEAADNLHDALDTLKTLEEELIDKKEEFKELLNNEPDPYRDVEGPPDKYGNPTTSREPNEPEHGNWVKQKNLLHSEIQELENKRIPTCEALCNRYILAIKMYEQNIKDFNTLYSATADILEGGDSGYGVEFTKLSLEERLKQIDKIISELQKKGDAVEEYLKNNYKNGILLSDEQFKYFTSIVSVFGLDVTLLRGNLTTKEEGWFDKKKYVAPMDLLTILQFCKDNDLFSKIDSYMNGKSYEESGLASVLNISENQILDNMALLIPGQNGIASYLEANRGNGNLSINDVVSLTDEQKEYIKSYYNNFDNIGKNFLSNDKKSNELLDTILSKCYDYKINKDALETYRAKIYKAKEYEKQAPFLIKAETADFAKYEAKLDESNMNFDATLGGKTVDKNHMTEKERALYFYIRDKGGTQEYGDADSCKMANDYVESLSDSINQCRGRDAALEFINETIDSGPAAAIGTFANGFGEGVGRFTAGFSKWTDVISGNDCSYTEDDYRRMYKAQYFNQLLSECEKNGELYDVLGKLTNEERQFLSECYKVGDTVGFMAVPMAASVAIDLASGGIGGKVITVGTNTIGSIASSALMGAAIGGETAYEARVNGYSTGRSILNGVAIGVFDAITELAIPGVPGTSNLDAMLAKRIVDEMAQEGLQTIGEDVLNDAILGKLSLDNIPGYIDETCDSIKQAGIVSGLLNVALDATGVSSRISNYEHVDITKSGQVVGPNLDANGLNPVENPSTNASSQNALRTPTEVLADLASGTPSYIETAEGGLGFGEDFAEESLEAVKNLGQDTSRNGNGGMNPESGAHDSSGLPSYIETPEGVLGYAEDFVEESLEAVKNLGQDTSRNGNGGTTNDSAKATGTLTIVDSSTDTRAENRVAEKKDIVGRADAMQAQQQALEQGRNNSLETENRVAEKKDTVGRADAMQAQQQALEQGRNNSLETENRVAEKKDTIGRADAMQAQQQALEQGRINSLETEERVAEKKNIAGKADANTNAGVDTKGTTNGSVTATGSLTTDSNTNAGVDTKGTTNGSVTATGSLTKADSNTNAGVDTKVTTNGSVTATGSLTTDSNTNAGVDTKGTTNGSVTATGSLTKADSNTNAGVDTKVTTNGSVTATGSLTKTDTNTNAGVDTKETTNNQVTATGSLTTDSNTNAGVDTKETINDSAIAKGSLIKTDPNPVVDPDPNPVVDPDPDPDPNPDSVIDSDPNPDPNPDSIVDPDPNPYVDLDIYTRKPKPTLPSNNDDDFTPPYATTEQAPIIPDYVPPVDTPSNPDIPTISPSTTTPTAAPLSPSYPSNYQSQTPIVDSSPTFEQPVVQEQIPQVTTQNQVGEYIPNVNSNNSNTIPNNSNAIPNNQDIIPPHTGIQSVESNSMKIGSIGAIALAAGAAGLATLTRFNTKNKDVEKEYKEEKEVKYTSTKKEKEDKEGTN